MFAFPRKRRTRRENNARNDRPVDASRLPRLAIARYPVNGAPSGEVLDTERNLRYIKLFFFRPRDDRGGDEWTLLRVRPIDGRVPAVQINLQSRLKIRVGMAGENRLFRNFELYILARDSAKYIAARFIR